MRLVCEGWKRPRVVPLACKSPPGAFGGDRLRLRAVVTRPSVVGAILAAMILSAQAPRPRTRPLDYLVRVRPA